MRDLKRIIKLVIGAGLCAGVAAWAHDPWAIRADADGSTLRVLPESARVAADGTVDALVENVSAEKRVVRRRMIVGGCPDGPGVVSIEFDDTGFGVQQWHSSGTQAYDMLAKRICMAGGARKQHEEHQQ